MPRLSTGMQPRLNSSMGTLMRPTTREPTSQTMPLASRATPTGDHHRTQSQPAKLFRNGELLVHRDFSGQIPLCFYATGLESGGSHDYYECFDERNILLGRRGSTSIGCDTRNQIVHLHCVKCN